ncbi:MAG: hypothetical protein AAFQ43_06330 [Bacteroidota bacterium]
MLAPRHLLWIDCTAGGLVGALVLLLHDWLSGLYGLPVGLVIGLGVANLVYASYSFNLARRHRRPLAGIVALAGANVAWAVFLCVVIARYAGDASVFGLATLVTEVVFVGGLGLLEWRHRDLLRAADSARG